MRVVVKQKVTTSYYPENYFNIDDSLEAENSIKRETVDIVLFDGCLDFDIRRGDKFYLPNLNKQVTIVSSIGTSENYILCFAEHIFVEDDDSLILASKFTINENYKKQKRYFRFRLRSHIHSRRIYADFCRNGE